MPSRPEQRSIAHILGTLDDKIELNRRMNRTLEEMARALFKSWFVDFDPVRAKATLKHHDTNHSPLEGESAEGEARSRAGGGKLNAHTPHKHSKKQKPYANTRPTQKNCYGTTCAKSNWRLQVPASRTDRSLYRRFRLHVPKG